VSQSTLITERLLLRPFELSDAADVERLAGDARVSDTTLRIPHPYPAGGGAAWIGTLAPLLEARVASVFAITERESGGLIGAIGLEVASDGKEAELGYWIGVPHWKRGYATEAASAVLEFAFGGTYALERIIARYFTRNPASGRVLEKIGMRDIGAIIVPKGDRAEHTMLRAITAEEWRAIAAARSQPS
jgi:RimJ/RimL family protein N-acetyltransferase